MSQAYCALRVSDYQLVYLSGDGASALSQSGDGKHWATGNTQGDALIRAAIEVGQIRRGKRIPRGPSTPLEMLPQHAASSVLLSSLEEEVTSVLNGK